MGRGLVSNAVWRGRTTALQDKRQVGQEKETLWNVGPPCSSGPYNFGIISFPVEKNIFRIELTFDFRMISWIVKMISRNQISQIIFNL